MCVHARACSAMCLALMVIGVGVGYGLGSQTVAKSNVANHLLFIGILDKSDQTLDYQTD